MEDRGQESGASEDDGLILLPPDPCPLPLGRFCRSRLDTFLGMNYIAARSHASVWRGSVAAV